MNRNYILWAIGAIVVVAGVVVFLQRPGAPSSGSVATDTAGNTSDTGAAGTPATGGTNSGIRGSKPTALTTGFASVSSTTATVVGTVIPQSAQTTYWFEYGSTPSLGLKTNTVTLSAGASALGAAAYITGLKPNTQYHFRLGASNVYGTSFGAQYSFITAAK